MSCHTYGVRSLYVVHPDVESRVSNHLQSLRSYGDNSQSFLEYDGYYIQVRTTFPPFLSVQDLFPFFLRHHTTYTIQVMSLNKLIT
jgi:hypothetical protein